MKTKFTFASLTITALLLCAFNNSIAQSWVIGGNNLTKDTSFGSKTYNTIKIITDNNERMRITSNGNIAIGTAIASKAKFTVSGAVGNTSAIFGVKNHGISMIYDNPTIGFNNYYDGGHKTLNDGYGGIIQVSSTTGQMYFSTAPYGVKDATATPIARMTILQNGYVGIGTSSPVSLLHINGNETLSGNLYINSDQKSIQFALPGSTPQPMMYMFPSGTINTDRMVIAHSPSYPDWGLQYSDLNDNFEFLSAGTSVMHIGLNTHYIGIGTTTPSYSLDVCGTIRAKEVRVETGWCDYVFDKNYKLKSLDEVESYVNENKHLPGITPASEVEKDGLKVGEMNKAMMEKIEELTLYVIQLSKDNKKLQEEINALKK